MSHDQITLAISQDALMDDKNSELDDLFQNCEYRSQFNSERAKFRIERKMFGFDYGQLGCKLMHLWHLPENFQEITQHHFEPEKAQHYPLETAIVHLAYTLTQAEIGYIDAREQQAVVSPLACKLTKLNENDLKTISANAQKNVQEVLHALWPFAEPPYRKNLANQDRLHCEDF